MSSSPRSFSAETLAQVARAARLELPADRLETVGPVLAQMYADIDRLDDVPIGETPPAAAFDARWEV